MNRSSEGRRIKTNSGGEPAGGCLVREHDFKDAENAAEEEHWFQF
jgi:hypothetical protein